jgi:hypothetical protein
MKSRLACVLFAALAMAQPPQAPPPDPKTLATVDGITVGPNHVPVAGTSVMLVGVGGLTANGGVLSQPYDAISDSEGRFSVSGMQPGRYAVIATHPDYSPLDLLLTGLATGQAPASLTLTAGQHKTDLEIELVPMTALSGKVTDENGDPMADVTVRPMRAQTVLNGRLRMMHAGAAVQTHADGTFELSVYTGPWYLSFLPKLPASAAAVATGEPEREYITTYFPGVQELPQASGIEARGLPVPGLNVRLRKTPVYHVRGKVIGPVTPDSRIVPTHEGGSGHPSVVDEGQSVHADGTFDLTGLTPGAWTLVLCQYGQPATLGRRALRISDTDVNDFNIALQPAAAIAGLIKTVPEQASKPASKPARVLTVRLTALDPLLGSAFAEVHDDGSFIVKGVEAGRYRVDFTPPPGGYVKSVTLDGADSMDTGIDLSNGAASAGNLQIVVSMTAGQIMGTVVRPDGGPPSTAVVTLVPDGPPVALYRPELRPVASADPGGNFVIKSVAPGTYRLYAWERLNPIDDGPVNGSLPFADPEFPRLFDSMSALVTVAESESKQVSLTLISAAKMEAESRRR